MKKCCAWLVSAALAVVVGFVPAYVAAQTYSLTGAHPGNDGGRVAYASISGDLAGYDAIRISANGQLYVNQSVTLAHDFFLSGSRNGNSLNAPSSQEAGSLRTDGQVTLTGNITLESDTGISVYGGGGNSYFTGSFIDTTGYKLAILKPNVVATMHLQGDNSAFAGHWYLYDTVRVSTNNTSATPAAGGGDQRFGLSPVNMQGGVLVAAANDTQLHSNVNLIAGSYNSGYSATIETPAGMPMHLRGGISGDGTLQKTGTGVLNLYGNVADSTIAVNMGALALRGSGTLNPAAITVGASGKLQLAGTAVTTIDDRFQLQAGTLQISSGEVNVTSSREVGKLILDAGANAATSGSGALVTASLRMGNNLFSSSGGNMTVTGSDMASAPTLTMKGGTLTPAVLYSSDTLPDFGSGDGTPKLHVQFDASSSGNFTLENGNEITAWKDTSGSGNDGAKATTGTPSSPITLTSNGLNGMPTVKFSSDGVCPQKGLRDWARYVIL